jgi:hypothetical protein
MTQWRSGPGKFLGWGGCTLRWIRRTLKAGHCGRFSSGILPHVWNYHSLDTRHQHNHSPTLHNTPVRAYSTLPFPLSSFTFKLKDKPGPTRRSLSITHTHSLSLDLPHSLTHSLNKTTKTCCLVCWEREWSIFTLSVSCVEWVEKKEGLFRRGESDGMR